MEIRNKKGPRTRALTDSEYCRVLQVTAKALDDPNKIRRTAARLIRLALATGLRRCELVRIKIDDIDLQNRTILINGKGNKTRLVEWIPEFHLELSAWIDSLPGYQIFLFPSQFGGHIGERHANRIAQTLLKEAGVGDVSLHATRHTFCSWEAERLPMLDLKDQVGHSSYEVTEKYYRSSLPGRRFVKTPPKWRIEWAYRHEINQGG